MQKSYLWTKAGARLQYVKSAAGKYNWFFLPGGPGLGSESLAALTSILQLPGTIWHVDFPGDGSNLIDDALSDLSLWKKALIEAVTVFDNAILVAHSSGGMFALTIPELESVLQGLVLMGSSPDSSWQNAFMEYMKSHPLPHAHELQKLYIDNPSNALLKEMTIASAPVFLTTNRIEKKREFFDTLPYNCASHVWFDKQFHTDYQATWVPKHLPTLIFSGDEDPITPIQLFKKVKDFQRSNILIETISNASHFPWMENPQGVVTIFNDYCQKLI